MINLVNSRNDWLKQFSQFDPWMIREFISLWEQWVHIKTIDNTNVSVFWWGIHDPEFHIKMRWVVEFLNDLNKNIWQ